MPPRVAFEIFTVLEVPIFLSINVPVADKLTISFATSTLKFGELVTSDAVVAPSYTLSRAVTPEFNVNVLGVIVNDPFV